MMKRRIYSNSIVLLGTLSLSVLAGCSGGKTYGTGVSQERQLAADIGGVLLLGGDEKKDPIDYSSRPKLVKAPETASLPTPAERVTSDSAYFPTDPEVVKANKLAALKINENHTGVQPLISDTDAPKIVRVKSRTFHDGAQDDSAAEYRRKSLEGSKERLARVKEARGLGAGAKKRKYLTQPPVEYQIPAETAEIGKLGEYEKSAAEKQKTGIFGSR